MENYQLITIALALCSAAIIIVAYLFFNDDDLDNDEGYIEEMPIHAEKPYVELHIFCNHTGQKTDVVTWSSTTCEEITTYCDTCGKELAKRTDC